VKHLNKKSVGFGLLLLIFVVALLGFTPKNASSFMPNNHQQEVLVINASDTDTDADETESDDDDDECKA
jgi:hypothetical protein